MKRPEFPENKYYAEGISEPVTLDFKHLSWWKKDRLGWPIETFKNKPIKSFLRIVCQNIRKITG